MTDKTNKDSRRKRAQEKLRTSEVRYRRLFVRTQTKRRDTGVPEMGACLCRIVVIGR
jgi:hypothetical protein